SEEPNALVENCFRYQSHALFIANGHKANGSEEHQYKELSALFKTLEQKLDDATLSDGVRGRLARRLVTIAATFYASAGGGGGPGQMGYITEGSVGMVGKAGPLMWNRTGGGGNAEVRSGVGGGGHAGVASGDGRRGGRRLSPAAR